MFSYILATFVLKLNSHLLLVATVIVPFVQNHPHQFSFEKNNPQEIISSSRERTVVTVGQHPLCKTSLRSVFSQCHCSSKPFFMDTRRNNGTSSKTSNPYNLFGNLGILFLDALALCYQFVKISFYQDLIRHPIRHSIHHQIRHPVRHMILPLKVRHVSIVHVFPSIYPRPPNFPAC